LKNKTIRILFCLLFLVFISGTMLAQNRISSPYSRFGIGNLFNNANTYNLSMGGTAYALRSPMHVNAANPASYTAFDSTSFVFEGGLISNFSTLKTDLLSQKSNYTSLSNLLFGFPVTDWWRSSFGLVPFSNVGYKIVSNNITSIDSLYSEYPDSVFKLSYQDKYEGSGGINQVYWGNAFKLNKNLSIGINATFLFGSIEKISATEFPDSATYFNSRTSKTTYVHDFYFTYGIQYFKPLKHDLTFGAGAVFSKSSKIKATQDILSETYTIGSGDIIQPRDSIVYKDGGIKGDIIIPTNFGIGLSLKKSDIWLVATDYQWQNWNKFKSFNEKDSLKNSWRAAIGAQYVPQKAIFPRMFDRIEYRLGFHYSKTYLELQNNQLNEMGFSFGIGLPLRKSKSNINFSIEAGRQGTTANNLLQENYVKFSLSVSLSERWFIKSKYD